MNSNKFIEVCKKANSMSEAAAELGLHFNTFKRRALKLGCYLPNQGLKNTKKPKKEGRGKIPLDEILNGNHPQYQTFKLKNRLFESGLKDNKCEMCGVKEWNGVQLNCELDHINGIRTDHRLENLRVLCPNCHSQTETYRAKNIAAVVE